MAFEIDHDWQGNLATPKARIGEGAKTRLLIVLCAIWIFIGLIGHQPWKPNESTSITIVTSMLNGEDLITPTSISENSIQNPPLYYLSAAAFAKTFSSWLPIHDAARIASGFWMALTLLLVGMIGRELWGEGIGRQTTVIFISSIGLIVMAHLLMPEVSTLTGYAMGFYALALAKRRPFRASLLLGSSIGIGFLSTGVLAAAITVISALSLPIFFKAWRSKSYAIVLGLALIIATPWLALWPLLAWQTAPDQFLAWWHNQLQFPNIHHLYFLRTLGWFAWPALPIAAWGLWRFRAGLLTKPKFQLIITYFTVGFVLIGFNANNNDISTLPLLLPLVALAGGSVETLKRGAAGALNWFGLILFGLIGLLIWLGWIAITTGWPTKLSARMHILSGLNDVPIYYPSLIISILVTLIWIVTINAKRSNRAAVNDWAVGMTIAWSLLMTLWLPMIDSAKSYQSVMNSLQQALPKHFACINSHGLGSSQQSLLNYYTHLKAIPLETSQNLNCDLYLIQDDKNREKLEPDEDWTLIWQGKRPAERREYFRLYQKN